MTLSPYQNTKPNLRVVLNVHWSQHRQTSEAPKQIRGKRMIRLWATHLIVLCLASMDLSLSFAHNTIWLAQKKKRKICCVPHALINYQITVMDHIWFHFPCFSFLINSSAATVMFQSLNRWIQVVDNMRSTGGDKAATLWTLQSLCHIGGLNMSQ